MGEDCCFSISALEEVSLLLKEFSYALDEHHPFTILGASEGVVKEGVKKPLSNPDDRHQLVGSVTFQFKTKGPEPLHMVVEFSAQGFKLLYKGAEEPTEDTNAISNNLLVFETFESLLMKCFPAFETIFHQRMVSKLTELASLDQ